MGGIGRGDRRFEVESMIFFCFESNLLQDWIYTKSQIWYFFGWRIWIMISKAEIWRTRYVLFCCNLWIVVNNKCLKKLIFSLLYIFPIDFHNWFFHRDGLKGSPICHQPDIIFLRKFDYRWNLLMDISTHSNGQIKRRTRIRNFKYYIYIYIYVGRCFFL